MFRHQSMSLDKACTARISSKSFNGSRLVAIARSLLLAAVGMLTACRSRSQGSAADDSAWPPASARAAWRQV